ncbi:DUF1287 domain-containing protein [Syntrophomonas curvata]
MKKLDLKQFIVGIIVLLLVIAVYQKLFPNQVGFLPSLGPIDAGPACEVPLLISDQDQNNNKIPDALDLVNGARQEVEQGTRYDASFYAEGYPPEGKGACTDVIWRAFKTAGYDFKAMLDEDIRNNPEAYGATGKKPDPQIDFRRVKNQQIFFKLYGQELTVEVVERDVKNLKQWQPGDIVIFAPPYEHIGIISDQRLKSGVPLVIHNGGPRASEANVLQNWPSPIAGHYRYAR